MKIHNFSAGPSILPREVMEEAAQGILDFNNSGLGIIEMSHRTKPFEDVRDEAVALVRELMQINDDYGVVFLTGGASTQFFQIPMNLLDTEDTACYVETGVWAKKAIKEAKLFGQIEVLSSSKEANFNYIPTDFQVPEHAKYVHITSNNTIYGTQYNAWPHANGKTVVVDMSSDIFSREVDYNQFGLIYAGAQKNMGVAGTTLVVVRKDLLGKVKRPLPSMVDYSVQIENGSMYNTPPVFPIYLSMLVLRWIKKIGGIAEIEKRNDAKAKVLYDEIDRNPLFRGTAEVEDRSKMNICFVANDATHETEFMEICKQNGIYGLKGHRSVGGFRASTYNALPIESVQFLVKLMQQFETSKK
ncbi:MAG TPA: 3-phosphoserine/phosphohydroxythreonine transaminase [Saprospiraceae bacterium]|nr:3-phosphoserine/phosphohydroxythreonine transaminase [Saprospiraceae bacterium]HQW56367.1 3-phosphoserine/phosphohydroxythreonine transaminase [Saprospiraceae bacterium]